MIAKINKLRFLVLTWTIFMSTFFWTSTMRLFLKPEISSWKIMNFGGKGNIGEYWLLPFLVFFAVFIIYLESRGKIRWLFYSLLTIYHITITFGVIYGSFHSNSKISFGAWGVHLSLMWLILPFIFFTVLAILWIILEIKTKIKVSIFDWNKINFLKIVIVTLLFPLSYLFFSIGSNFNWQVKIAIIINIIQWILLTDALGKPS